MNRYPSIVVPGAGLLLALLVGILLLAAGRTAPPAHGDPPPSESFAVLSQGGEAPPGLADAMPGEWVTAFGLDLGAATSAEATSSATRVAVVPGIEGVCIVTEAVAGCATWLDAGLGKLALVESCSPGLDPGEVRVTGLIPDQAATAAITRPPAAAINVSAPLNVYVETFSGDPEDLASTGLAVPVDLPWDSADQSLNSCIVPSGEQRTESDLG